MNLDNHLSMEDRHAAFVAGVEYGMKLAQEQSENDWFIIWCDGYNKGLTEGMERGNQTAP